MLRLYSIIIANKTLFLILLIASLVRFVGLIPNIANTDEGYILKNARLLFYGIVTTGDFDPHAYKYGSLIFYLQSLVYIPFYLVGLILVNTELAHPPPKLGVPVLDFLEHIGSIWEAFFLWEARAVTAVFGILSVLIVYLLVKKLFGYKFGIFASFIFALNPFHVRDSHYATTDVLFIFFILLSLLFLINAAAMSRFKWYILSGLVTGISATIKFFPLVFLVFPIAIMMDKQKREKWLLRIFAGIAFIFIGLFLGLPFLLLKPENKSLLEYEVGAQFLWYGTTLTTFLSALLTYVLSLGKTEFPSFSLLAPGEFAEFHSSFLTFKVFGPVLMAISLIGILISAVRFPLRTLFLLTIPMFTFVYISFYVPAVFERLSLPIVPFLSIFAAIFLLTVWEFIAKKFNKKVATIFLVLLCVSSLYYPAKTSFVSSLSCSQERSEISGVQLIEKVISPDRKIVYVPPVSFPNKNFKYKPEETRPDYNFFLTELQKKGIDYLFVNTGLFTRFTYSFENNFLTIPPVLYENYYVPLAMKELKTRAILLGSFSRHPFCDISEFFYFEIPQDYAKVTQAIQSYTFDNEDTIKLWLLEDLGTAQSKVNIKFSKDEGHYKKGSLAYSWTNLYYRGPRLVANKIGVVPNGVYTFTGWVKPQVELVDNERDAFLRIDFFDTWEDNTLLPGKVVGLSPRVIGPVKWYELTVTVRAPETATFAILSFNVIGTKNAGGFYLDDFQFLGPKLANE